MSVAISYTNSTRKLAASDLVGFFEGWRARPTPEDHLRLLQQSHVVVLALASGEVIGFVTAISDGVVAAYIPLLEVRPAYRGRGIGTELVRRALTELGEMYMVDLVCDPALAPFYERLGFQQLTGMARRHPRALKRTQVALR